MKLKEHIFELRFDDNDNVEIGLQSFANFRMWLKFLVIGHLLLIKIVVTSSIKIADKGEINIDRTRVLNNGDNREAIPMIR